MIFHWKKMSVRWGERPLGRGMEDRVIRSHSGFSGRSAALASSKTTNRSRLTAVPLQKTKTTPDYLRSLCSTIFPVDSSLDSFSPVPPYFRITSVSVLDYRLPITFSRCWIDFPTPSLPSFLNHTTPCPRTSTRPPPPP